MYLFFLLWQHLNTSRLGWWASAGEGLDPIDNEDNDDDPEWLTPVGGDTQSAVLCVRLSQGSMYQSRKYEYMYVTCLMSSPLNSEAMLCIILPVHGSIPKIYVCYSWMQKTLRISLKTWYLLAKGFVDNKIAIYTFFLFIKRRLLFWDITTKMTSVWRQREERK